MLLAVLYLIAWVYIAAKYLVPFHNKWEKKIEPVIQSLVGLVGLWIVNGIMIILLLFVWFIPVMWIIERF